MVKFFDQVIVLIGLALLSGREENAAKELMPSAFVGVSLDTVFSNMDSLRIKIVRTQTPRQSANSLSNPNIIKKDLIEVNLDR